MGKITKHEVYTNLEEKLDGECKRLLREWPATVKQYKAENFIYKVRDKEIKQASNITFQFSRIYPVSHKNSFTFYLMYEGPLPATSTPKEIRGIYLT